MAAEEKTPTREREARVMSGWPMLVVTIARDVATPVLMVNAFVSGTTSSSGSAVPDWWLFGGGLRRAGRGRPAQPRVLHHSA